jgi:hypothetical protein
MELLFKDFRTFIFARARQFLEDFIDFISGPKTFLRAASVYSSENLARAFSFFLILYVLVNLLFVFFIPPGVGTEKLAVFNIVYTIVFFTLCLLVLQVSWLVVGARPPLRRVLLAFLFFSGIGVLIQMLLLVAWVMIAHPLDQTLAAVNHLEALSAADPVAADEYMDANPGVMLRLSLLVVAFVIYLVIDLAWVIVVWGAFRELAGTGRLRSALALAIFFTLALLLFFFSIFFIDAFAPGLASAPS